MWTQRLHALFSYCIHLQSHIAYSYDILPIAVCQQLCYWEHNEFWSYAMLFKGQ